MRIVTMKIGLILIFLFNISSITAADDPFEELQNENITFWHWDSSSQTLFVKFNEEVEGGLVIAYIKSDVGDDFTIGKFQEGSNALLGAEIFFQDSKYGINITEKQDYESNERSYYFPLYYGGDKPFYIDISVNDIDDNPPEIFVNQRPCIIPENTPGPSECTFTITDEDSVSNMSALIFTMIPAEYEETFEVVLDIPKGTVPPYKIGAYLNVTKSLDFETTPMYYFQLNAEDSGHNKGETTVNIQVKDLNDQPPFWTSIFATKNVMEKTSVQFEVLAEDGDKSIKAEVNYMFIECTNVTVFKNTTSKMGIIKIDYIDRDGPPELDMFTCVLEAYEEDCPEMRVPQNITFMIEDMNDNKPVLSLHNDTILLNEKQSATLNNIFSANDIDHLDNAKYDVTFTSPDSESEINFSEAFQIIPGNGYQEWDFTLAVVKPSLMDYDKKQWRNFTLQIEAKDHGDPPLSDSTILRIVLHNMNDQQPIFEDRNYTVSINETAVENTEIITIKAIDYDTDDYVTYNITLEQHKFYLENTLDDSVTILTKKNNVFDYEKQQVVLTQVAATDHLDDGTNTYHTVTQQITINVLDVNDETPRIKLPPEAPEIKENTPNGCPLNAEIVAEDVDTTADLIFALNWTNSWATTKQGSRIPDKDSYLYEGVFEIKTCHVQMEGIPSPRGYAIGTLSVADCSKLDYEKFELLYLQITVEDKEQVVNSGFDKATLTIRLQDENDCPPIFDNKSIESLKRVEENAKLDTLIGTIFAKDEDGPYIKYSLTPVNNTEDGLVDIDEDTGVLKVTSEKIDADIPQIYYLYYNVTANDSLHVTTEQIEIFVVDQNDEEPKLKYPLTPFLTLDEGHQDTYLQTVYGIDHDRDDPHNKVTYFLNTEVAPTLTMLFTVDQDSGIISINGTLDRDFGPEFYDVFLMLMDNRGDPGVPHRVTDTTVLKFRLIVEDLNTQDPILPDLQIRNVTQDESVGAVLGEIQAIDKDKPCTDNTKINYTVLRVTDENDDETKELIFDIETKVKTNDKCEYFGVLRIAESLKQYYGKYKVHVQAQDNGEGYRKTEKSYDINIIPFNFEDPSIIFPAEGATIILDKDYLEIGKALQTIDEGVLKDFNATDNQGNKYSMYFVLVPEDDTFLIKTLPKNPNSRGQLQLKKTPEKDDYLLTVKASHDGTGNAKSSAESTFRVHFMDKSELPTFGTNTDYLAKIEENNGSACETFPAAVDHKCEIAKDEKCFYNTYYHIISGNEEGHFEVNLTEPIVCVKEPLDRETIAYYYLNIVATNGPTPPRPVPEGIEPLNFTVEVLDVNDNPPKFEIELFSASMTSSDKIGETIVKLYATDPDISDEGKLVYDILNDTMEAVDSSIQSVKDPFKIEKVNEIVNLFKVQEDMKGYFMFKVRVHDSNESHIDTADVKIYIISKDTRIGFTFKNDVDTLNRETRYIELVFSQGFGYNCTVDDIEKKVDSNGKPMDDESEIQVHFIDEEKNEPVDSATIRKKLEDDFLVKDMQLLLTKKQLKWSDIKNADDEDLDEIIRTLRTLLIVVSVVLGILCIVLFIAFILRSRSLQKRLEAMTTNVFGSTKSDLNRIGTNAPGTNKHAIEANPVWNEDLKQVDNQFDSLSQASGGSDLIGIEENPEFQYGYRRDSINPAFLEKNKGSTNFGMDYDDEDNLDLNNFKPSSMY